MPRLLPVVLALVLGFSATACKRADEATPPAGDVGARLALPTFAGEAFDPATLDGKPAVVMFWRPSCPHCVAELPDLLRACNDKGATAVAVMVTGTRAAADPVLASAGWNGVSLTDDGTLTKSLGIKAVPYTLVLRPDGTAARAFVGRQSYGVLAGAIAAAR